MVNGVNGRYGTTVQLHVGLEGNREIESAVILNLILVVKIVLGSILIQNIVQRNLVQVRHYLFMQFLFIINHVIKDVEQYTISQTVNHQTKIPLHCALSLCLRIAAAGPNKN